MYTDVINKLNNVSGSDALLKTPSNEALKCHRCIGKSEGKNIPFKMTKLSLKSCLASMFLGNGNVPVSPQQVNRCEVLAVPHLVKQIVRVWKWESVFHRLGVEQSVVRTHTQPPVLFRRE